MAENTLNPRKRRVFDSVFQPPTEMLSQPTPVATPAMGFTAPGQAFGRPVSFVHDRTQFPDSDVREPSSHVKDQVQWDLSWHTVTDYLSLFQRDVKIIEQLNSAASRDSPSVPPPHVLEALKDVLQPEIRLPLSAHREDLVKWHSLQVRQHFINKVLPLLAQVAVDSKPASLLQTTIQILDRSSSLYIRGLSLLARQMEESSQGSSRITVQRFRRDFHALVSSVISDRVMGTLKSFLREKIDIVLQIPLADSTRRENSATFGDMDTSEIRRQLLSLVESLHNVGLGGEKFQIIFAELMNEAMSNYVHRTFSGVWDAKAISTPSRDAAVFGGTMDPPLETSLLPRVVNNSSPSQCVKDLCEWIENQYSRLAVEVLSKLSKTEVAWNDVEKWKEMSIGRLAGLRTNELFDIVVNWPKSNGALDDLRTAVTTPQRRLQLTEAFSAKVRDRLLHPGTSTLQILRTYISMIWSFHFLDHSKVLLDRVAYSLQVYLCSREDTVRIIITGLLSDIEDADGNPIESGDKLVELAVLLNEGLDEPGHRADEDLDWDDMEWVPDPVDAGPGYKRSKSADIIGTLIGALGSQEVFIKEFQTIIGENLLKHEGNFEKEIKVLELLKHRFGEAPLQSCEVMIKDIQDSRRVNAAIRAAQQLDQLEYTIEPQPNIPEADLHPSLNAKILSRLFWPQLPDSTHHVPLPIASLLSAYESGFAALKTARKLSWLPTLGTASLTLDLADRSVVFNDIHTWQAAVIAPFADTPQLSVTALVSQLQMDESLVRSALAFWVSKMVLYETSRDVYAVRETLSEPAERARWNAQVAGGVGGQAQESELGSGGMAEMQEGEGEGEDKMAMYWQYVQGMLKNSAAQMPVQQIAMMLKMLIVDGFPYSNEELKEFLGRKVAEGELEVVGGKYRLRK